MLINLVSMHVSSSCKRNFGNVINVSRRNIARTFPSFLIFFFFLKLFNFEKTCINLNRLKELILFLLILLTKIFLINIKSIPIIHIGSVNIFLFDLYVENYYSFFFFSDVNGNINATTWSNNRFCSTGFTRSQIPQMIFHYSVYGNRGKYSELL